MSKDDENKKSDNLFMELLEIIVEFFGAIFTGIASIFD